MNGMIINNKTLTKVFKLGVKEEEVKRSSFFLMSTVVFKCK